MILTRNDSTETNPEDQRERCSCSDASSPPSVFLRDCSSAMLSSSSGSVIGVEITYPPLAHLPRSIRRHRSLQKGKCSDPVSTSVRQVGQRNEWTFFLAIIN